MMVLTWSIVYQNTFQALPRQSIKLALPKLVCPINFLVLAVVELVFEQLC